MFACMHVCMFICMFVRMYVCMDMCVRVCVCIYMYIYTYVLREVQCCARSDIDTQIYPFGVCIYNGRGVNGDLHTL